MKKVIILWLGFLVSVGAIAADLTDAKAKRMAIDMEATIAATRTKLNDVIANGDKGSYNKAIGPLRAKLNDWPKINLQNRAAFPYGYCKDAALAMMSYGDAWKHGDSSTIWRDHVQADFKEQYAACKQALIKPDMSLKNIK